MVKRTVVENDSSQVPPRKRRKSRAPTGANPSRTSSRLRGVGGDDPQLLFPNGVPQFRFHRRLYRRPICRMYGLDRNLRYKGYYFCSRCKEVDLAMTTKGIVRESFVPHGKQNECEANHQCFAFPTDKVKADYRLLLRSPTDDNSALLKARGQLNTSCVASVNTTDTVDVIDLNNSNNDSTTNGNELSTIDTALINEDNQLEHIKNKLEMAEDELLKKNLELSSAVKSLEEKERQNILLLEENRRMKELLGNIGNSLWKLRHELNVLSQQKRRAVQKLESFTGQDPDNLMSAICELLSLATNTSNCNKQRKATAFADLLMDGSLMDGALSDRLTKKLTSKLRSSVFSAPSLVRKMDECGFTLNFASIAAIGSMEKEVMGKFSRGIFPSTKTLKRTMDVVHVFGDHVLPFTLGRFPDELGGGELAKFPQELVLCALVKSHGLMDKAKNERVGIGYAYDGTKVDSHTYLEISGFKVTDRDAKDPKTGRLLYGNGLQSSACSFPDTLGIAKDTKEVFELYKPRFKRVSEEAQETGDPMLGKYVSEDGTECSFKHVEATSEMDMKTVWMINNVGCAAKQGGGDVMFCSFCPLTNRDIVKGTQNLCHKWCRHFQRHDEPGWVCHHVDMVTQEHIDRCKEEVQEMVSLHSFLSDIADVRMNCKMHVDEDPSSGGCGPQSKQDPLSIHFAYSDGTLVQKMEHLNAVRHDLSLRGLPTDGSARDQINLLSASMVQEYSLMKLQTAIKRGTVDREGAITLILNNPPCLLHLENRCGIKMITVLLQIGLANALTGKLESTSNINNQKSRLAVFEKEVNECFNKVLWGQQNKPALWKMPTEIDKDGNIVLSTLSFGNVRARNAMNDVDSLIDICILQNNRVNWKRCMSDYRDAMEIARSHQDLTDEDIIEFQKYTDDFYQQWLKLGLGKNAVTNYIHLLGSGHIAEFLFRWRNLYAHSQQGWEALNSLVRSVYFRRTNRGGGLGIKSKLYAIARWCQRRMLWASGYTYEYMESEVKKNGWTASHAYDEHLSTLPEEDIFDDGMDNYL